ncbi:MAG TPA: sigma-70 family RNA polymerase sigma factor [Pedobacter sp.]|nr:sigma-70 family RNA polymerase sigma factor [Pedobacter sp.]
MYPELTDEALTALLKSDDHLALETLFNRYYKPLCQFCTVYTRKYEASEEIIADLFIRLWDNRNDIRITSVKNYLFVSAKNLSINHHQKKKDPVDSFEDIDAKQHILKDTKTPFQILSARESCQTIISTIEMLPDRQREVLLMSRIDNLEKNRISELLGISVRTVETTLYQAIRQLRQLLKDSPNFSSRN